MILSERPKLKWMNTRYSAAADGDVVRMYDQDKKDNEGGEYKGTH